MINHFLDFYPTQKNKHIMINKKQRHLALLFFIVIIGCIFSSCKKAQDGYEPVKPLIGFANGNQSISVPGTSTTYSIVELDISEINKSFGYDVYFTFDDNSVVDDVISIDHDGYTDPVTGIQYYKIPIVQGVKKGAFTFIPREDFTGNKTFTVTLVNEPGGSKNYTIDEKRNTATITINN